MPEKPAWTFVLRSPTFSPNSLRVLLCYELQSYQSGLLHLKKHCVYMPAAYLGSRNFFQIWHATSSATKGEVQMVLNSKVVAMLNNVCIFAIWACPLRCQTRYKIRQREGKYKTSVKIIVPIILNDKWIMVVLFYFDSFQLKLILL